MTGIVLALAGLTAGDGGGAVEMTAPALAEVRNADPLFLVRPGMSLGQVEQLLGEKGTWFVTGIGIAGSGYAMYSDAKIIICVNDYRVVSVHRPTATPARPE